MTAKRYLMSTALVMSLAYMPASAQEQQTLQKDSTTNTKEEKNRNVMLNASNNDRPRDISIGLPASFGITIFEDGLPVSYSSWPCLPFKSWAGGAGQGEVKLMSLGEAALRNGTVGYIVDSYVKDGSDKFKGNVNYSLNHFGRQVLDLALTGSFGKGWGYNAWTYQTADPGTYSMKNTHLQDRTQIYKLGISKTWNDGRGIMSAFFKYAHSRNWADSYAPFYYETDGSITQLDGFTPGRNSYLPSDGRIDYIDPITGESKTKDLGDGGSIDKALEVNFRLKYTYTNGNQLTIASKYRDATTDQSNNICVGIANTADGDPKTSPKYYYWDGRLFNGNYQNRMIRQVDGDEKSWMTNAQLTGKGGNHAWRVGFDLRYNKHGYTAAGTFFAHEVKADPERFYMKDANGNLVRSWLFNKSAEYCDGHETKVALYASDDWDISRHFWLSAGVRLEYFNACGYAANNVDGATNNSRTIGWYLNNGTATKTRFNKDYLNPSVDVNARYTILKGFGLVGEYVFNRQRAAVNSYAGTDLPTTSPSDINMGRIGIFYNNKWLQLVSQFSYISQSNNNGMQQFTQVGTNETITANTLYDIATTGWTTDIVLTPAKGLGFHGLLTLQSPKYKNYTLTPQFSNGESETYDFSNKNVSGISKIIVELDPSYQFDKWRVWLSFRYQGKQYINMTNSLFFKGRWESFGGIDFNLNKNIGLSLSFTNIFNQKGVSGSIASADLVSDTTPYNHYLMAGSYIRPFTVEFATHINF